MRPAHAISPWHTIHRVPIDDGNTSAWRIDSHPRRAIGAELDAMKDGRGIRQVHGGTLLPLAGRRSDYLIGRACPSCA